MTIILLTMPIPPGTGVKALALALTAGSTSPTRPPHDAFFDHFRFNESRYTHSGNDDISTAQHIRNIPGPGMADSDRSMLLQEQQRHRLANYITAPDNNDVFPL